MDKNQEAFDFGIKALASDPNNEHVATQIFRAAIGLQIRMIRLA
jgi:hypothetical protein